MADYRLYPAGKDQTNEPGIELNGEYYGALRILIALIKALIKKGVITRAEVAAEL